MTLIELLIILAVVALAANLLHAWRQASRERAERLRNQPESNSYDGF
jgi:type II secretory pathway pseudopilin PulG